MIKAFKEYNEKVWKPYGVWCKKYWWVYITLSFIVFSIFWIWLKWEKIVNKFKTWKKKLLNHKEEA